MRYEYTVLTFRAAGEVEAGLNEYGRAGWHVIAAWDVANHFYMFTLERELTS